ncbi:MAG: MBL fold metallo-hydrolase [Planctomycetota bacterium]|jgi:L-ascorbate metabolism protein UlaG (beta-lactamase superfamily)
MKLGWLGHASFLIETEGGIKIVTDPYDRIGLKFPPVSADVVTVSHDHFDHSAAQFVQGNFTTVSTQGGHDVAGVKIKGLLTFHDDSGGSQRGSNIMFVIEADGIRLCHAGDLGHMPSAAQVDALGRVDILCLPVGGTFTIDAAGAAKLVDMIKPKIAVPMHYKIPGLSLGIADASAFLSSGADVRKLDELVIDAASLPAQTQIAVLAPRHG